MSQDSILNSRRRIRAHELHIDRAPPRGELHFTSRNARCAGPGQSNLLSRSLSEHFEVRTMMRKFLKHRGTENTETHKPDLCVLRPSVFSSFFW